MKLDFTETKNILARVTEILDTHHGKELRPDVQVGPGRRNDPELAALGRDLLYSVDMLRLASSEVSNAYWLHKGRPDARYGD